jgi:hypothetical protein
MICWLKPLSSLKMNRKSAPDLAIDSITF